MIFFAASVSGPAWFQPEVYSPLRPCACCRTTQDVEGSLPAEQLSNSSGHIVGEQIIDLTDGRQRVACHWTDHTGFYNDVVTDELSINFKDFAEVASPWGYGQVSLNPPPRTACTSITQGLSVYTAPLLTLFFPWIFRCIYASFACKRAERCKFKPE